MKKSIITLAAASTLAVTAAQAETTLYGRVVLQGTHADSTWALKDNGSRFGIQGGQDLDSGLRVNYQIEVGLKDASLFNGSGLSGRKAWVGLSGPFGNLQLGSGLNHYYGATIGAIDAFSNAGPSLDMTRGSRINNAVRYSLPASDLGLSGGVLLEINETTENAVDAFEAAFSFALNPLNIGVAYAHTEGLMGMPAVAGIPAMPMIPATAGTMATPGKCVDMPIAWSDSYILDTDGTARDVTSLTIWGIFADDLNPPTISDCDHTFTILSYDQALQQALAQREINEEAGVPENLPGENNYLIILPDVPPRPATPGTPEIPAVTGRPAIAAVAALPEKQQFALSASLQLLEGTSVTLAFEDYQEETRSQGMNSMSMENTAWYALLTHSLGHSTLKLRYGQGKESKMMMGMDDMSTRKSQWAVGLKHTLSPRTWRCSPLAQGIFCGVDEPHGGGSGMTRALPILVVTLTDGYRENPYSRSLSDFGVHK